MRARAIDVHVKRRRIEGLLHVNVDGARDVAELVREFLGEGEVGDLVVAAELDVLTTG